MNEGRRRFLELSALAGLMASVAPRASAAGLDVEDLSVADLQARLQSGELTARALTQAYLSRIEALDRGGPALRSVIELNPDALKVADELDAERTTKGPRGPLHGLAVLVKDNCDTGDRMLTTAGSLALATTPAPRDSFVVQRLRAAGCVLLGKTNLSEWANIRSAHSSSGWSGRGGQTRNPHALDRNPCGSSSGSGVAVAASLCSFAVGTETDGSIVCPSSMNGIVGIKPTLGLVSRSGIVPISHNQDTAGPMARTVADAAALLSALAATDPEDAATAAAQGHLEANYTRFLDPRALRGARLGVARNLAGFDPRVDRVFEEALLALQREGAVLVDPADLPHKGEYDDAEQAVLLFDLKADLAAYLQRRGPTAGIASLADAIAWNAAHADLELRYFGQDVFEDAQKKGPLNSPEYVQALQKARRLAGPEGLDAVLGKHQLDALLAPTAGPAWLTDLVSGDHYTGGSASTAPAVAGTPHVTVPMGQVFGLPVGLSFLGRAWSEPRLIALAHAFEVATQARRRPRYLATADLTRP
jgi:amidase